MQPRSPWLKNESAYQYLLIAADTEFPAGAPSYAQFKISYRLEARAARCSAKFLITGRDIRASTSRISPAVAGIVCQQHRVLGAESCHCVAHLSYYEFGGMAWHRCICVRYSNSFAAAL